MSGETPRAGDGRPAPDRVEALYEGESNPLLDRFPGLRGRLPWLPLGRFPTPVEPLPMPLPGGARLLVKRDDLTSKTYGGNKVRKLEHLLADYRLSGVRALVTLGAIGSHHALATAIFGVEHGFDVDVCLFDQPLTEHVRRNLLAIAATGARVHYRRSSVAAGWAARRVLVERRRSGVPARFVMIGGTTPLGAVGYVSAALELAAQVREGVLPPPDRIYIAAGTCGTAAGLVAGLTLAGLRSRVVAVRVLDGYITNRYTIRRTARATIRLLRRLDPSVPDVRISLDDCDLETRYFEGYGVVTEAALAARRAAEPFLDLETTYTAKAFAACMAPGAGAGRDDVVLFWHTVNSAPMAAGTPGDLPAALRARLEEG